MSSGAYQYIKTRIDDRIQFITIDRPEVLNALNPQTHAELSDAFDKFAADDDRWVAILSGAGDRAFSAGTDLKARALSGEDNHPATGYGGLAFRFDLHKPVIAAVNGLACGGGMELALACDLVVASATAWFSLPETHVGLAAIGGGGIHRLMQQIPQKIAMELILTGRRIEADEALALGLVNRVVENAEVHAASIELAQQVLRGAPLATQASKQVALGGLSAGGLEAAMKTRFAAVDKMLSSEDAIEGQRAFVQKRQPNWRNS